MTQTAAPKTAKTETPKMPMFEMPKFEMPKFDMDSVEVPAAFREIAEKAVSQAKAAYDRAKVSAEEATEVLEDTFSATSKHATELNKTVLSNAKSNLNASFELAEKLFGVKTMAEALELQSEFARKQFEALSARPRTCRPRPRRRSRLVPSRPRKAPRRWRNSSSSTPEPGAVRKDLTRCQERPGCTALHPGVRACGPASAMDA